MYSILCVFLLFLQRSWNRIMFNNTERLKLFLRHHKFGEFLKIRLPETKILTGQKPKQPEPKVSLNKFKQLLSSPSALLSAIFSINPSSTVILLNLYWKYSKYAQLRTLQCSIFPVQHSNKLKYFKVRWTQVSLFYYYIFNSWCTICNYISVKLLKKKILKYTPWTVSDILYMYVVSVHTSESGCIQRIPALCITEFWISYARFFCNILDYLNICVFMCTFQIKYTFEFTAHLFCCFIYICIFFIQNTDSHMVVN